MSSTPASPAHCILQVASPITFYPTEQTSALAAASSLGHFASPEIHALLLHTVPLPWSDNRPLLPQLLQQLLTGLWLLVLPS